jgi:metal-sulfur cluster biosynthetic enzyme
MARRRAGAVRVNNAWDPDIAAALEAVHDPCSLAAGTPMSLRQMGLVRGWEVSPDGDLEVRLDVTAPVCLMAGHFVADAQRRLEAIAGLRTVTVRVDPSGDWSPERMSRPDRPA